MSMVRLVLLSDLNRQVPLASTRPLTPYTIRMTPDQPSAPFWHARGSAKEMRWLPGGAICQPKTGLSHGRPEQSPRQVPELPRAPGHPQLWSRGSEQATKGRTGDQGARGFRLGPGTPPRWHWRRTQQIPKGGGPLWQGRGACPPQGRAVSSPRLLLAFETPSLCDCSYIFASDTLAYLIRRH